MAIEIWVSIGSGNGLLLDGTKPLPEPILTFHQSGPVTITCGQFRKKKNHLSNFCSNFPVANELNSFMLIK